MQQELNLGTQYKDTRISNAVVDNGQYLVQKIEVYLSKEEAVRHERDIRPLDESIPYSDRDNKNFSQLYYSNSYFELWLNDEELHSGPLEEIVEEIKLRRDWKEDGVSGVSGSHYEADHTVVSEDTHYVLVRYNLNGEEIEKLDELLLQ